ncbi:unnamed protein product, partial [Mycena citricolor]
MVICSRLLVVCPTRSAGRSMRACVRELCSPSVGQGRDDGNPVEGTGGSNNDSPDCIGGVVPMVRGIRRAGRVASQCHKNRQATLPPDGICEQQ